MKKIYFVVTMVTIISLLTSCISTGTGIGVSTTNRKSDIDGLVKNEIDNLNKKVINSINTNNINELLEITSKDFKNNSDGLKEFLSKINGSKHSLEFKVIDEYHSTLKKVGNYNFTITTLEEDNPFFINNISAPSDEIYIVLMSTDDKINKFLMSLVYVKEKEKWRLFLLSFGDYAYQGLNAIEYFQKAKQLKIKGDNISAFVYMNLASKLLRPSNILQYKKENEFIKFHDELSKEVINKYKFPIELGSIESKPNIFNISVTNTMDGVLPIVMYKSNINLDNTEEIEEEANKIALHI